MKRGYKHNNSVFGTDSERYVASLFMLMRNPNGDRRPDLVSVNGRYSPKLSIEVKSGKKNKGILVQYQLHYAITTEQDYIDLFGEEIPAREGMLPGANWEQIAPRLRSEPVAYYYCLINRTDGLKSADMGGPWSAVKIHWGNQYLVPSDFGFYCFAVCRAKRTGEKLDDLIETLRESMKEDVLEQSSHYADRKGTQNWQNIHGRDIEAVFKDDLSITTKDGKERIRMIRDCYPALGSLQRILIPGPAGNKIYILAEPNHKDLFDSQLRATVEERVPIIERITRQRENEVPLIESLKPNEEHSSFANGGLPSEVMAKIKLNDQRDKDRRKKETLDRLTLWSRKGEEDLSHLGHNEEVPF